MFEFSLTERERLRCDRSTHSSTQYTTIALLHCLFVRSSQKQSILEIQKSETFRIDSNVGCVLCPGRSVSSALSRTTTTAVIGRVCSHVTFFYLPPYRTGEDSAQWNRVLLLQQRGHLNWFGTNAVRGFVWEIGDAPATGPILNTFSDMVGVST